MKNSGIIVSLLALCLIACKHREPTLFEERDADATGIKFRNLIVEEDGLNISHYIYFYNGAGVAVGDINNDGLVDIFFAGNMVKNRLFLNKGNFKFENITDNSRVAEKQGWCTGASMVDINQDGLLDIYICRSADDNPERRKNLLYINLGDLTFSEEAEKYGLADNGFSTHASFFDFDKDGDLDCFVLNHSVSKYSVGVAENPEMRKIRIPEYEDHFYRNDEGHFTDISAQAGIIGNALNFGLGVAVSDFNNDGWPDMYVSNDFDESDYFYLNNKQGGFTESFSKCMQLSSLNTMGMDAADYNNDGLTDIVTLDMLPETNYLLKTHAGTNSFDKTITLTQHGFQPQFSQNALQKNNGDGTFSEIGQLVGISNTDWSWSALFCDFDGDTHKDLFVDNGYVKDFSDLDFINFSADKLAKSKKDGVGVPFNTILEEMPTLRISNYMFRNLGNGSFENKTAAWGLDKPGLSYGAAYADLDNDGDMDLVTNNTNDFAGIYENHARTQLKNNYLQLKLEGSAKNRNGYGTKVKLFSKGQVFYQEQFPVRGYQSSVDQRLNFGLGTISIIDSILVVWPNDAWQVLKDLPVNQSLVVKISDASGIYNYTKPLDKPLLSLSEIPILKHTENNFNDFNVQRLMPNYLSRQGPALASADINKDGLKDLFLGNAKDAPSGIFFQTSRGDFIPGKLPGLNPASEVTTAEFFDADRDGDPDLYIGYGGYEFEENDPAFQDQLMINDGKGNFSPKPLPELHFSKGCVKAGDMDGDGDLDLFIGGRLVPGKYPTPANSRILVNDGKGNFSDQTRQFAPAFDTLGMVTDAAWIDLNNDKKPELVVVGEWMPVKVFSFKNVLSDVSAEYIHFASEGWWNRIAMADLDGDGDDDLVLGNAGLNTQFHVSEKEPISELYGDFDKNGSIDPILFYYIQGKPYPAFSREEIAEQLPALKKKFLTYKSYGTAQLNDLFSPEQLKESRTLHASFMETIWLENTGKELVKNPLPVEAQYAPVYAIVVADFNGDHKKDLILAGNNSWTRVRFGRYTANQGVILLGDGKKGFHYNPQTSSGLNLRGNVRNAVSVGDRGLVLGINDGPALLLHP